ncbi:hypothetical protein HDU88_000081 [Geranomyces variabilis]|nr:hypothetical protein HDU88_000081 [Geranomyces variabilis]
MTLQNKKHEMISAEQNSSNATTPSTTGKLIAAALAAAVAAPSDGSIINTDNSDDPTAIPFRVTHGKKTHEMRLAPTTTVAELKDHVEAVTGVSVALQKLLYKGLLKNEQTIDAAGIVAGAKVMLMASKVEDIVKLATAAATTAAPTQTPQVIKKTPMCEMTEHKKVLDKGKPDDVEVAVLGVSRAPIPSHGLRGMLNQRGDRVRLTFKLEQDQVWIGTKETTQRIQMSSIRGVRNEPIASHPEYHILVLQLGPTEKSNYYFYWTPCQYIASVKEAILGPIGNWL